MLKHYMRIFYKGVYNNPIVDDVEVEVRDDISKVTIPSKAYGVRFFDREDYVDQSSKMHKRGYAKNFSGTIYFGKEYSIDNIPATLPAAKEIVHDLKNNRCTRAVWTKMESWVILFKGDKVISDF